jgi:hypothetical protein
MLTELVEETRTVLDAAKSSGAAGLTLSAIARAESLIEKLAKISGELNERPQVAVVNYMTSPDYLAMRTKLLVALVPYPAARVAVAEALTASEPPGLTA